MRSLKQFERIDQLTFRQDAVAQNAPDPFARAAYVLLLTAVNNKASFIK